MPHQSKIINAINYCLKQNNNLDIEFNVEGVCAGLAGLYVKYSLENNTQAFFSILDQLSKLPGNYKLGDNPTLDKFIIQIEQVFNFGKYNPQLQQGDLEHILHIKGKPLCNEFNVGLIADQTNWAKILKQISVPDRVYNIVSHNHSVGLSYDKGLYSIYDPNYDQNVKIFVTAQGVIDELKNCFQYSESVFGLSIRAYAHPESIPAVYPEHALLHNIAFDNNTSIQRQSLVKNDTFTSALFASSARDYSTVTWLFENNAIHWDKLTTREFSSPVFNDLLMKMPPSEEVKKTICKCITSNIYSGNTEGAQKLIQHYSITFASIEETEELQSTIRNAFGSLGKAPGVLLMKQEKDYDYFLHLCEHYGFNADKTIETNYNHLKLLTLMHKENASKEFLDSLKPEQLIKQIETAAILNQHNALNTLLKQLKELNITPGEYPSIFAGKLINIIDALTLKKLLNAGFVANNIDSLMTALSRKDKTVFELYARSFAAQKSDIWQDIDSDKPLDLESKIGPVYLLHALMLVGKYQQIKNSWNDASSVEFTQEMLLTAISLGAYEISMFLKDKLDLKKSTIDNFIINLLINSALMDKNIDMLTILADLNYNILSNKADIEKIILLCSDYDNFSAIEHSFDKASPEIKKIILETSLRHNCQKAVNVCLKQAPELWSNLLNDCIGEPSTPNRDLYLNELNNNLEQLELLKIPQDLTQDLGLFNDLIKNKKLNLAAILVSQQTPIDEALRTELLTICFNQGNKNLLTLLLQKGLLTPETKLTSPLSDLIKSAISKGRMQFIEPLINSPLDFKLDLKELILWSFECKKPGIANKLLAKNIALSDEDIRLGIKQLVGEQSLSDFYEKIFQNAYGNLYELLLKNKVETTGKSVTTNYLECLKRVFEEKRTKTFKELFEQNNWTPPLDDEVIAFLKDPLLPPEIIGFLEKKYSTEKLLACAMEKGAWEAVANVIKQHKMDDLPNEIQAQLRNNSKPIVDGFVTNLQAHSEQKDKLFNLGIVGPEQNALAELAPDYKQIYNALNIHHFSNEAFNKAREELGKTFDECLSIIETQEINLGDPIQNKALINHYDKIKALMASESITPYYLEEEHKILLSQLAKNPQLNEGPYEIENIEILSQIIETLTEFCAMVTFGINAFFNSDKPSSQTDITAKAEGPQKEFSNFKEQLVSIKGNPKNPDEVHASKPGH